MRARRNELPPTALRRWLSSSRTRRTNRAECPQALQAHQPFDLVQAAVRLVGEQIAPDTVCAIGAIAGDEAGLDLAAELFIAAGSGAGRAVQLGMEA